MTEPAIDIRGLTFSYPDGHPALRDISVTIPVGAKVALVGANGSGKSTLLLHLNGIYRASSGSITIMGIPLTDKSVSQIRAWVGMVFQDPDDQLFSPRVYDDVAFAARYRKLSTEEVHARVVSALAAVGMSDYAERISHHMSMGEKKRIALATVLSVETRILALDEPSAGLDPRGRRELLNLLQTFTGQTMVISTHDMRLAAELCSHVIVLDKGRLVAGGSRESILYDADLMERHGLETP